MICGVTRSRFDPSGPTARMSQSQRCITHKRKNCSGCRIGMRHTWAWNMFVSILLHPRRTVKASLCVCAHYLVAQMQLLLHSGVGTLRGCQLLDPFCCPTQFTHAKAVFSVSRQAFSIMFQGALTFLGQTCCRWTCRGESCIDGILRAKKEV